MNTLVTVVIVIFLVLFLVLIYPAYNNIHRSIKSSKRRAGDKPNCSPKETETLVASSKDRIKKLVSNKWLKWAIIAVVLVLVHMEYGADIHHFLVGDTPSATQVQEDVFYLDPRDERQKITLRLTQEWSEVFTFPPGRMVEYLGSATARWQMRTQGGIYSFSPEGNDVVPDPIQWAQWRSMTEKPEIITVSLRRL